MMRVNVPQVGCSFDVRFSYDLDLKSTLCTISLVKPNVPKGPDRYVKLVQSQALCHRRDVYNKNIGRHEAFKRAMSNFTPFVLSRANEIIHGNTMTYGDAVSMFKSVRRVFWMEFAKNHKSEYHRMGYIEHQSVS
jgi:hypothetical protein